MNNIEAIRAWVMLFAAGIFEILWVFAMKYSNGFTKIGPSIITIILAVVSFILLSQALKVVPLGTGYTIWTGIGAMGVAIGGIFFLNESISLIRLMCIVVIILGIIGLKLTS